MEQSLGTGGGRVQTPPARGTIRPYQSHRPPIHRQRYHMWYVSIPCTGVSFLHLNLLHWIHLKVLQSTIRLVGPQWVHHHRQYLSPRPLWECNFERNRCNKLCHFERTQCMRCLPAQCEVLVPFYRIHPCGVHRTISNIHYKRMLKMLNFSMSTYFIHFEDYVTK